MPGETPSISAISAPAKPSSSNSWTTIRCRSGSLDSAVATAALSPACSAAAAGPASVLAWPASSSGSAARRLRDFLKFNPLVITMRYSHGPNLRDVSKLSMLARAARKASCTTSSASCRWPTTRKATA